MTEWQGKRVLVAYVHPLNCQILTRFAHLWKMETVCVASGSAALEYLRQRHHVDLAIVDMGLPDIDGIAVAEKIRHLPDLHRLPLLMLPSLKYRETNDWIHYFDGRLHSPIDAPQLYNSLIELFAGEMASLGHRKPVGDEESLFDPAMGERLPLRILLAEDNPTRKRPCRICRKWFRPNPRLGERQRQVQKNQKQHGALSSSFKA